MSGPDYYAARQGAWAACGVEVVPEFTLKDAVQMLQRRGIPSPTPMQVGACIDEFTKA